MTVVSNGPIFDDLLDVRAFVEVASQASFSRAAERLNQPRATVSRRITRLEDRVGLRLFERTTRSVQITPPGKLLLEHAQRIVDEMAGARLSIEALTATPSGRLRITAPFILGRALLGPIIEEFIRLYPDCTPFLDLTNRRVDLVEDGFDVAIRLGPLPSSTLIVKRVGQVEAALYVSSDLGVNGYAGAKAPVDLKGAPVLRLDGTDENAEMLVLTSKEGATETIRVRPKMISSEPTTLLSATRSGQGLGMLPTFTGGPLVVSRDLRRLLPNWAARRNDVFLVTPSNRHIRPAVRAFLDFASERIGRVLER